MQSDGTGWSVITHGEYWDTDPAWLADGTAVIFASNRCCSTNGEFRYQLYTASRSDRQPRRLTTASANDLAPATSRDGTRVAFVRTRPDEALAEIYVMRTDGSDLRRLVSDRQILQLGWIGTDSLAFMTLTNNDTSSTLRLMTVDVDKPARQPRAVFVCSDPCVGGDSFAVSPDGRFAAVTTSGPRSRPSSIVLIKLATGATRTLPGIPRSGICCVSWSATRAP